MPVTLDTPPDASQTTRYEAPAPAQQRLPEATAAQLRRVIDPASLPAERREAQMRMLGYSEEAIAGAGGRDFESKLKEKLGALANKHAANRPLDVTLGEVNVGEHAGIALAISAEWVANDHPRVAHDPDRAAYARSTAEPPLWIAAGGGVFPRAGFSTNVGSVSIGFSADASLSYSLLRPYNASLDEAKRLAKNASVDLPLTLADFRRLEQGAELTVIGRGRIATSAGTGVGHTLASNRHFTVGASAGISAGASEEKVIALRVKKLAGDEVFASVSVLDTHALNAGLHAFVGVDADIHRVIDHKIEAALKLELSAHHEQAVAEQEVASFVFSQRNRDADRAFAALMRLDTDPASSADAHFFGVRRAHLDEVVRSSSFAVEANAGPLEILALARKTATSHAVLERVNEDGSTSKIVVDSVQLGKSYSGIISNQFLGKRSIARSFVTTREDGGPPQSFYHLRYTAERDRWTSKGDLRCFLSLAHTLGALDVETVAMTRDPAFERKFLKKETSRTIDAYITHAGIEKGIEKVARASREELVAIHGHVYALQEGIAIAPWLDVTNPKYEEIMWLLHRDSTIPEDDRQRYSESYWRLTNRNLHDDQPAFQEGQKLASRVRALIGKTPEEQAELLASSSADLGFGFWRTFGAVAALAGPENVLVHELALRGAAGSVEVKSEGAIADPRAAIEAILARP
jgi:hypothetical protein